MVDIYAGPDRRKYERVKANFLVIYRVNEPVEVIMIIGSEVKTGIMSDLSEGGMALTTTYNIPFLTLLIMNFTLINTRIYDSNRIRTIHIRGQVRYSVPQGGKLCRLGIQFTKISNDDKEAINRFVELTSGRW